MSSSDRRGWKYRINRWKKNVLDRRLQPGRAWSRPSQIWMETHSRCNLKCPMCARELEERFHAGEDISDEVFEKAAPFFETADTVILYGWNEPLMDRRLADRMRMIAAKGARIHFNTNATLLDDQWARTLIDIPVTDIGLSFDGATRQTYESIRVGADFKKVKANIRHFVDLKEEREAHLPFLHLVYCVLRDNIDEIPRMPALLEELGVPRVDVTDTVFYSREMKERFGYDPDLLKKKVEEARAEAEKLGVEVSYWPYDQDAYLKRQDSTGEERTDKAGRYFCPELYKTLIILSNGEMVPCHFQWGEKAGNIHEQSFEQIWNNEFMQDMRQRLRQGQPPEVCRKCCYLQKLEAGQTGKLE